MRRTTRAERERTRERERERTRTHTDQGIERSFIVPGVGEAKSRMSDLSWWPGTSFWTMSDLTSLSHGSHWRMPSIALPILLPTRLCPQLALPTVARSGAPHLTRGNPFLPPCTWDKPHMYKNVHGTKPANGTIIAGGLCHVLVRMLVMFRSKGMNVV